MRPGDIEAPRPPVGTCEGGLAARKGADWLDGLCPERSTRSGRLCPERSTRSRRLCRSVNPLRTPVPGAFNPLFLSALRVYGERREHGSRKRLS